MVHVDVRGRGNSEGKFDPFFQEINDGFDCIEWAGKQKWSTGRVGTFGRSYGGVAQLYPLRFRSKYHKAAFIMCSPSIHPFHDCTAYTSGTYMPIMTTWAMLLSGKTLKEEISDEGLNSEPLLNIRPLKDTAKKLGLQEDPYGERYQHETYDSYYKKIWTENMIDLVDVPCYFVTGWYDDSIKGALEHFPDLCLRHPDRKLRRKHKLLIGPWPHVLSSPFMTTSKIGDFDYEPHSIVPLDREAIRWFDYLLKDVDNGVDQEPQVRVFLMAKNKWMDADQFPLKETKEKIMYLTADGPSNTLDGSGKLVEKPSPGKASSSAFVYDPKNPAPSPYSQDHFQNGMNEDLRYIQRRDDVLVFTSAPLERPLSIVGLLSAVLHVSTSAVDTDFIARLSDVHPNGYAQRLNHGVSRLRFREGYEKVKLVKPGEIMEIKIDMLGTGQQFLPGHRVRMDVTSSALPGVAPNYNTGGNAWEEVEPVVATNTVHHSREYPSRIVLPELPHPKFAGAWKEERWVAPEKE